jgi:SAM-dependent methyltransferase
MNKFSYVGSELDIFALASNWKNYYRRLIEKYIGAEVLEVGAGLGATTRSLCRSEHSRWICLEPDPELANHITSLLNSNQLPGCCEVIVGTVKSLGENEKFDTVLYVDVLEHIEGDREEAKSAANRLKEGGYLIILSPAHPVLYTPFDRTIGHYRRYTKNSLSAAIPPNLKCCALFYLDSVGAIASLCNRYIFKSRMPSRKQILFWDRFIVPLSCVVDPLFRYGLGKSLIGVWQKV